MGDPASEQGVRPAALPLRQALALGLLHGPTELLPISSSAHTILLPWLAEWSYDELDPERRQAFEVSLHAGTAAALLIGARGDFGRLRGGSNRLREIPRELSVIVPALALPAVLGYTLESRIARGSGNPRTIAGGLLLGGLALGLADARPASRRLAQAGPVDGLLLGAAQAAALLPGVSRNGATLTAARARGFGREDSQTLSWRVGLPVIVGAAGLKAGKLVRRQVAVSKARPHGGPAGASPDTGSASVSRTGASPGTSTALAGAGAAFSSTLACAALLRRTAGASGADRGVPAGPRGRLLPFGLYRAALAVWTMRTLHDRARRPRVARGGRTMER